MEEYGKDVLHIIQSKEEIKNIMTFIEKSLHNEIDGTVDSDLILKIRKTYEDYGRIMKKWS